MNNVWKRCVALKIGKKIRMPTTPDITASEREIPLHGGMKMARMRVCRVSCDGGFIFGDGIEFRFGMEATIDLADKRG